MKHKYMHFGRPSLIGIYYHAGNTYCENLDGRNGKIIVMIPEAREINASGKSGEGKMVKELEATQ